jgi:predicted nucleotidyltransferase
MAEEAEKSALERIAEVLSVHGVEFIVVGGQAELLMGSPRVTYDIDLCYRRTKDNLRRLAAALREIKPTLRNAPADLPFIIDEQSLALGSNFTFDTPHGPLDFLGYLEPLGDFEAITHRASTVNLGGVDVRVIHIDDLIAIKRHLRRPKDQQSLLQLLAIKRLQAEDEEK